MDRLDLLERYDVAIAGGGAIGAVLACALADGGAKTLLVDPAFSAPTDSRRESDPDAGSQGGSTSDRRSSDTPEAFAPRPLALSLASWRMLEALGIGESLTAKATPIRSIHISEAGRFGAARLAAARFDLECFGKVVDAASLGRALDDALERRQAHRQARRDPQRSLAPLGAGELHLLGGRIDNARVLPEGIVPRLRADADNPEPDASALAGERSASLSSAHPPFAASLLAIADGGRSPLREALHIATRKRIYPQLALATVVGVRSPRPFTAFERFTPAGPVALLPMGGSRYGLVFCAGPDRIHRLAKACESDFLAALDATFGGRMGGFCAAGQRRVFDLRLEYARNIIGRRRVSIGNAAHHLHPVAGQGFNLGLRDVACLAQTVSEARAEGRDGGDKRSLLEYRRWRAPDHARTRGLTDALVDIFGHRCSPLASIRAPGLVVFDLLPGLKRALTRQATGLAGRVSDLALGIPPTAGPGGVGEGIRAAQGLR